MAFGEWFLIYRGVFYKYKTFDEVSNILNNIALALHNVQIDDDKYFALLIHIESDYVRVASCIMYKIIFDRNSRTYKMCPFSDYNS